MRHLRLSMCMVVLCLLSCTRLYACEQELIRIHLVSKEYMTPSSTLDIAVMLRFDGYVQLNLVPDLQLAGEWSVSCPQFVEGVYQAGDSLLLHYFVDFEGDVLPFYPQRIRFFATYKDSLQLQSIASTEGHYYFTPYNSLEVYDDIDFYQQPRVWMEPQSNQDTNRVYIAKEDIPAVGLWASDTLANGEIAEEVQYKHIKGLAYLIPMHPISEDSMAYYSTHIGDSVYNSSGRYQMAHYSGMVSGTIFSTVTNDLGDPVKIPISGQIVRLLEEDFWGFEVFGETVTDETGFFEIPYSESQTLEGGQIELFLKIKAKADGNGAFMIKGKDVISFIPSIPPAQNPVLGLRSWVHHTMVNLGQVGTSATISQNYDLQDDHFRVVHWARKGQQYVDANGGSTGNAILDIYPNQSGGGLFVPRNQPWFFPYTGVWWKDILNLVVVHDPCIFLSTVNGNSEKVPRHEFGHFLMWRLQHESYIFQVGKNPFGGTHFFNEQNPTRFVWSEGWASAVGMILDAVYREEDGEYGSHLYSSDHDILPIYECRVPWDINPIYDFTNGFRSEYYIALSIYDLWDGVGKNLPNALPVHLNVATNIGIPHGWNDTYLYINPATNNDQIAARFTIPDNVEFSFQQIMQPLLENHPPGEKPIDNEFNLNNITEYIHSFLSLNVSSTDCEQRAAISTLLQQNRLVAHIPSYKAKLANTCINTDIANRFVHHIEDIPPSWFPIFSYVESWNVNLFAVIPNQIKFITFDNTLNFISEHVWLGGQGLADGSVTSCLLKMNGSNISESIETCGGAEIHLNVAVLEIGDAHKGELIVNAGSELKIAQNGRLVIHDDSKVVIEQGAKLTIEEGAQIELLGNNAVLEIHGNLDLKNNAMFTFDGTGFVRFAYGNTITAGSNTALTFIGNNPNDKVLEIADNSYISNYALSQTTLQNGKCVLGENAFWDTGNGQVLFENAIFTALDPERPYQSIYTNGQAPMIHDCVFSYGERGITARNFGSLGAGIGLSNVEIHHCKIALQSYDKGGDMYNVNFHDNVTGWKQDYAIFNSNWTSSQAYNNEYAGVWYEGNTRLNMKSPQLSYNQYGVVMQGTGTLQGTCGYSRSNYSAGIALTDNATLDLAESGGMNPKMDLGDNTIGIFTWGGDYMYLKNGYNNVSPKLHASSLAIAGYINTPNSPLIFRHNHWNEVNPLGQVPNPGTSPVQGQDYITLHTSTGNPILISDVSPIAFESCNSISTEKLPYVEACIGCELIYTPSFDGIRIDSALQSLSSQIYVANSEAAINILSTQLSEIIAYNYSEISTKEQEVLDAAWRMLKSVFVEGVKYGYITVTNGAEWSVAGAKVAASLQKRISQNPAKTFALLTDKISLYLLANQPEVAVSILSQMQPTDDREVELKEYWSCYIGVRNEVKNGTLSNVKLQERLSECPSLSVPIWGNNENKWNMDAFNNFSMELYPNPTPHQLNIQLSLPHEMNATIEMYDISGKNVFLIEDAHFGKGFTSFLLPLPSLPSGLYNLVFRTEYSAKTQKVVIE